MNTLEAVKLRIGLTDNEQDVLITELISDATARVLAYINQDGGVRQNNLPTSLDYIIKEISVRMYNAIGDEGKKSSSEGEISNTWNVIDLSEYADALDVYRDNFKRRRPGMRFV